MHWSKPWTDYVGLTPASSFLPVAVMFDLISYLQASGHLAHSRVSQADPTIPLLHYTIPRRPCSDAFIYSTLKPCMVGFLLNAKENSNLPCPEISPYQQALNFADHFYLSRKEKLLAFEILAMMLNFGADPQVSGEVGQHMYASTILDDFYFKERSSGKDVEDVPIEVLTLSDAIDRAFESNRVRLETLFREEQKPKSKRLAIKKWIKKMKA